MPISREEVQLLRQRLSEPRLELSARFGAEMSYAEYDPRSSDLFEYFVLYDAALSIDPCGIIVGRPFTRGDARSAGWIPFGLTKPHKTAIKMGRTLVPNVVCSRKSVTAAFWFDKSLAPRLRPDIVVRKGRFEVKTDYSKGCALLLRDDSPFAGYSLEPPADLGPDSFVEETPRALKIGQTVYLEQEASFGIHL